MLAVTRKRGEAVVINPGTPDEVRIVVTEVRGGRVNLGVATPPHVLVRRPEYAPPPNPQQETKP